jgi:hypothetical protein
LVIKFVHGGGKSATKWLKVGFIPQMIDGRRITDAYA